MLTRNILPETSLYFEKLCSCEGLPLLSHLSCEMLVGEGYITVCELTTSFFLASVSDSSVDAFLFTGAGFSFTFFCASRNAEISSGQSRFSSGSQVLSALHKQNDKSICSSGDSFATFPFKQMQTIQLVFILKTMNKSTAQPPYQGSTSSSAGVPGNSLCKSFPLQEEFYFPIDNTLVEYFFHHKFLWFLLCLR